MKFKDKHKGETCIIMGTGPSLREVPIEYLQRYLSFGVNKIWLGHLKDFSPTYYVATDPWMNPYTRQMRDLRCREYFLLNSFCKHLPGAHPLTYKKDLPVKFSYEPLKCLWKGGGTVVFICLQLAYYMGFETVLLLGIDHTGDGKHYHPDYDKWGAIRTYKWNAEGVEKAYQIARDAYEADGRRIVNLTIGTKCEVFEKEGMAPWLMPI